MKSVTFKSITIQHFLSVGEPLELIYQPGISVVTGVNHDKQSRNGIGKSAVLTDALFFALYGKGLRDIGNSFIPNRVTGGRPIVRLEFEVRQENNVVDSYLLERTMKPARLFLSKNGEDISRNMNQSTNEIHTIIDASPDVFRNCVIMSLNGTIPFMSQSKLEKRRFIEGILGLDVFSDMLKDVRDEINDEAKTLNLHNETLRNKKANVARIRQQQTVHKANQSNRRDSLQQRIADLKTRIEALSTNSVNVDELLDKQKKAYEAIEKLESDEAAKSEAVDELSRTAIQLESKCDQLQKEYKKLTKDTSCCPTCKRAYDDAADPSVRLAELDLVKQEMETTCGEHGVVSKRLVALRDVLKKYKSAINQYRTIAKATHEQITEHSTSATTIATIQENITHTLEDIEAISTEVDQFQALINTSEAEIDAQEQVIYNLSWNLSVLEDVRFVVSEEGVKSYIVRQMLTLFNTRLAWYLKKLNANCTCTFNELFEETIIDESGNETTYANFSAGEAKRIDLAMLFTFQDIRRLQADTSINICVYDELFDSSLDETGVASVVEILRERVDMYGECTYVITHRSDALAAFDNISIVHLEKRDGVTTLNAYENIT